MEKDKCILESVQRGLKEKATIYRGSFAKYVAFEEVIPKTDTVTDIATKYLRGTEM